MTPDQKAEIKSWMEESAHVEKWNDVSRLALYDRAKIIIPLLVKELASYAAKQKNKIDNIPT